MTTPNTESPTAPVFRNNRALWTSEGFELQARISVDTDPDLSFLGEFSDKPGDFAISHQPGDNRTYAYFNPENAENAEDAQEDYERMCAYDNGDWHMCAVVVAVFYQGVNLGFQSLYGIESDSGETYFAEVATELAHEAISEARITLAKLRDMTGPVADVDVTL